MSDTPEALAAILAEMRHRAENHHLDGWESVAEELEELCERIDAAAAREYAQWHGETNAAKEERNRIACKMRYEFAAKCRACKSAPGNAASMRGALDKAECVLLVAARFATDNAFTDADARENLRDVDWDGALAEIDAALAAPPEPPSNAAKIREALEYAREVLTLNGFVEPVVRCDAALAAPARNCDRFATEDEAREAYWAYREPLEFNDKPFVAITEWLFAPAEGGAKCIDGLRGEPDCRGCNEHCEDVRKRNCFYWNPDIEGGVCALTGKKSCPISCGNFHVSKEEKPDTAEGGAK